ncbi:hypothetical protein BDV38DRAFT_246368 [Aspergillus pseudotamarii]|uniref:Uncharacterized protein n=1 Tax=Aspergillus pseudotamarii TaxID=132259 RepID=A0A5N6SUV0_ASPPS|nr:uncharacterized protein BDV38DRAFT_246368 [Aspergillus pseudotamarii]KAE8137561.1 hypothetical protein BDV38DRAFT_246368 [Aspergillus pseudotamarii]
MHQLHAQSAGSARPRTDYERWLEDQAPDHQPTGDAHSTIHLFRAPTKISYLFMVARSFYCRSPIAP